MQWTWAYRYLFEILNSFPLNICPEWDYWIIWQLYFYFLEETSSYFAKWPYQFTFTPTMSRVSFSPHPCWHTLSPVFLMIAILTGVKWYFIVIFILISLTISDVELLFVCLLAIWMFWKKYLFRSLAHFLIKLVGLFLLFNFMTSSLFWIITLYRIHGLQMFSSIP